MLHFLFFRSIFSQNLKIRALLIRQDAASYRFFESQEDPLLIRATDLMFVTVRTSSTCVFWYELLSDIPKQFRSNFEINLRKILNSALIIH